MLFVITLQYKRLKKLVIDTICSQLYQRVIHNGKRFISLFSETENAARGRIFSHVRPFYERAVSDLDRAMNRSLWVLVTHSSFIEGLLTTKNAARFFMVEPMGKNY